MTSQVNVFLASAPGKICVFLLDSWNAFDLQDSMSFSTEKSLLLTLDKGFHEWTPLNLPFITSYLSISASSCIKHSPVNRLESFLHQVIEYIAQSCPTLCDPMDCSLPGFLVHGIFQARVLEWVAISFSRRSSWPRDRTQISRVVGRHFTVWATRETQ